VVGKKRLTVRVAYFEGKGKIRPKPNGAEDLAELLEAFFLYEAPVVKTARELAQRMAAITRLIRELIAKSIEHEREEGWIHNWWSAFREILIPDLNLFLTEVEQVQKRRPPSFDDMFAQTLALSFKKGF